MSRLETSEPAALPQPHLPLRPCLKCARSRSRQADSSPDDSPENQLMRRRNVSFTLPTESPRPPPTSLLDDFVSWVTTSLCAAPRKTLQSLQVDVDEPEIPHAAM
jgi:hypothetical protein